MLSPRPTLLGAAVLAAGCSQLQLASAGQTACAPKAIQISDVERGWNSEAWVATCGGKRYRCSSVATAWSVDYACKLEGEAPVPDGAEPVPPDEDTPPDTTGTPGAADDTGASDDTSAAPGPGEAKDTESDPEPDATVPAAATDETDGEPPPSAPASGEATTG